MNIEIAKIVTIRSVYGCDTTYLHTRLPDGVHPFEGFALLTLQLARGSAEVYVPKNFPGIPHEIIGDTL